MNTRGIGSGDIVFQHILQKLSMCTLSVSQKVLYNILLQTPNACASIHCNILTDSVAHNILALIYVAAYFMKHSLLLRSTQKGCRSTGESLVTSDLVVVDDPQLS